jgi:two-component system chemotaxis sensor kinase CheA
VKKLDISRFLDDFKDESIIHIKTIESAFLNLSSFESNADLINNVFRAAHSLKGTAGFYSLENIVAVSHKLESLFTGIKNGNVIIDDDIVKIVLESVDKLKDLINVVHDDESIPFDLDDDGVREILEVSLRHGHKIYFIEKLSPEMTEMISKIGVIVKSIPINNSSDSQILATSVLEHELFSLAIETDKKKIRQINLHSENIASSQPENIETEHNLSVRLNISTINDIMDLANEMILTRNQLLSTVSEHAKTINGLTPVLYDINRLTTEVQEKIMFTRMQPISVVFDKFPRIIYDTAKALGKEISISIIKDDVTLDKYLLEALTDPITQIIKNSADHGLESTERRRSLGKPPKGTISLNAYIKDGFAVIEISDDGKGIDVNAIKKKAAKLKLKTKKSLKEMTDKEIYNLMFIAGVSTAEQVTNLSGRGIGMNIVKTNIEKLKGTVEIESELDKGTTVRLKMPLTLSVIRTLIVEIDKIQYAVPDLNIERIVRITDKLSSKRIEKVNKSYVLVLDGRIIPIVTMDEINARVKNTAETPFIHNKNLYKLLILKADNQYCALMIDEAIDTEQILLQPLPPYLQDCPCYSNVTVLGNGNAVTILDTESIMRYMKLDTIEKEAAEILSIETETAETVTDDEHKKQVIVFKCSGPEYFAALMDDVARIEIVRPEVLQDIGDGCYIGINNRTIRVLRPEDFTPVQKLDYTNEKLYIITLETKKADDLPIGLLVKKVVDKYEDVFNLDDERFCSDFVHGTSIYNNKIIIFLNAENIAGTVT